MLLSAHRARFAPRVFPLKPSDCAWEAGLATALSRLRGRRRPVLFDSAGGSPRVTSLLAFDPLDLPEARAWSGLRELWRDLTRAASEPTARDVPGPFAGGWAGALAYDLGVHGEGQALPEEPWGGPLAVGGVYTDFLVRDEVRGATWLVLGEDPGDGRPDVRQRRDEILDALTRPGDHGLPFRSAGPLERCVPAAEHRARIERARQRIAAGDLYQANLAHRLRRDVVGHPVDLYLRLRAANPAPYMGYCAWGEGGAGDGGQGAGDGRERIAGALLSSSPELLLELDGRRARTRPIKGTAPRGRSAGEDRENAAALLASEKDRAELGMIVDLERNDLGRVAVPGTVRVRGFPTLESYASVHHLVADVVAEVRPEVDVFGVVAALFPGGSISGAPKLRSMEVIAELEGEGRGFFTGSMGFVDVRGRAAFNVLIRTLQWRPRGADGRGEVSFRVGGGITWSSDAAAEELESLHKAEALARALETSAGEVAEELAAEVAR